MINSQIAAILRANGNSACIRLASQLEAAIPTGPSSLTLRELGLSQTEVLAVADAIATCSQPQAPAIISLSMSYHETMGNAGAIALAQSLPSELHTLGLVRCRIGDPGGEALLKWAEQATHLSMLCIEENHFSTALTDRFTQLGHSRARLMLVV